MIYQLADSEDPVKFIFFGVVAFIYIVSNLLSSAAKKREQERRLRVRESIQSDRVLPPQLPLPPVQMQLPVQEASPVMLRRIDTPQRQKPRPVAAPKKQKSRKKLAGPPPLRVPQPPLPAAPVRAALESASPTTSPTAAARPASATASTLQSWLKPATLRQQFILTEVFQPPISLR